jgi:hypothetical protein
MEWMIERRFNREWTRMDANDQKEVIRWRDAPETACRVTRQLRWEERTKSLGDDDEDDENDHDQQTTG